MKRAIFFVSFISVFVIPAMPDYPQENSNSHPVSRAFFSSLVRRRQESATPKISWKTRIVGGIEAQPNQFPYQVSIHVRNYFGGYDHLCGGVIYDAIHIVTAAHCLSGYHHRNLKVIAGEHDLFKDEGPEQYRDVASTRYHPGFIPVIERITWDWRARESPSKPTVLFYNPNFANPQDFTVRDCDGDCGTITITIRREIQLNDIGIITLDHPLDLNDQIQPLRLPNTPIEYSEIARTSGWGEQQLVAKNEEQESKLMYVDLTYFPRVNCSRLYDGWAFIEDGMLCYGDSDGGKGGCNGDSGGPLVCKADNGTEFLCGLVSWGMRPCALAEFPTVFVDTNWYLNWLHGLLPPQELSETIVQ